MISKTLAVMITGDNIEQLLLGNSGDRYEGDLLVEGQDLVFRSHSVRYGKRFEEAIPLDDMIELSLAFDERLKDAIGPSFSTSGSVAFAVCYRSGDSEKTACFNIYLHRSAYFNAYLSDYHVSHRNHDWYQALKDAVDALPGKSQPEKDKVCLAASSVEWYWSRHEHSSPPVNEYQRKLVGVGGVQTHDK